ncbi:glycosyltransferase [Methylobacterium sp. 190mf]|uniref:glycosyltransferase family 32 protein n=1 Tax=Methylobacterium sp. 190mf TaxID=1761798 RepID=UPI000D1A0251|nr:glycosyltransferase [Methylobacterium sp. 190mf]
MSFLRRTIKTRRSINISRCVSFLLPDRIPRKIHQLWIPPAHLDTIPHDVLPQIQAWKNFHPDFEHRIWTINEVAAALPPQRAERMTRAIRLFRFEAMKADLVRLYLLSEFGGFWSDLKVRPRRQWLHDYLRHKLVLIEHFSFAQLPDPTGILTNNLIGAAKGSDFIEECIERAHYNVDNRLSTSVWHVAGTKVLMDIYAERSDRRQRLPQSTILKSDYVWSELTELGNGSYSADKLHWSVREKEESIYLE